jgi:hypothetical protein
MLCTLVVIAVLAYDDYHHMSYVHSAKIQGRLMHDHASLCLKATLGDASMHQNSLGSIGLHINH